MVIYIQCDSNGVVLHVGTSPIGENPIEVEVDSMDIFDNPGIYKYDNATTLTKDESLLLTNAKEQKMNELNGACNASILDNFAYVVNGTTYYFPNDDTAQKNFDKFLIAFQNGYATSPTNFTCFDASGNVTRLAFDETNFPDLYKTHLNHIAANVAQFRDNLALKVSACTTVDEVNAITWTGV